jgi:hypothetical protein
LEGKQLDNNRSRKPSQNSIPLKKVNDPYNGESGLIFLHESLAREENNALP